MKTLTALHTQQVSGGAWVLNEELTNPVAVGYCMGMIDAAVYITQHTNIESKPLVGLTMSIAISDGTFTLDELSVALDEFHWG